MNSNYDWRIDVILLVMALTAYILLFWFPPDNFFEQIIEWLIGKYAGINVDIST